jgi:hypothetical protein
MLPSGMREVVEPVPTPNSCSPSELFVRVGHSFLTDGRGITIGTSHLVAEKHFPTIFTDAVESCLLYGLRVFQDPGSKSCFPFYPFLVIHLCPFARLYETTVKPRILIHKENRDRPLTLGRGHLTKSPELNFLFRSRYCTLRY